MEVSLSDFWSDGQYPVEQPSHLPIRATSGVINDRCGRIGKKTMANDKSTGNVKVKVDDESDSNSDAKGAEWVESIWKPIPDAEVKRADAFVEEMKRK